MKIFPNDLKDIQSLANSYTEGDSIEIFELTIKDSAPELIFIINLFRKKTQREIIINTEEDLTNAILRLAALKQYPNLVIRKGNKDIKIS